MNSPLGVNAKFPHGLDQIETDWSMIHEPAYVVMRYASAIANYMHALINNRHDAEEVAQDFFLWVSQNGLPCTRKDRGRFRDYLKKVVRNAAANFLRRNPTATASAFDLSQIPAPDDFLGAHDQEWIEDWRRCILDRAWQRLRKHQGKSRQNLAYTTLRLFVNHPEESSKALAAKVAALIKKPFRADAFRKQVSRARQKLAHYLVDEVAQTLDNPEPKDVEEELVDLGLIRFVRDFLPLRRRVSTSCPRPVPPVDRRLTAHQVSSTEHS